MNTDAPAKSHAAGQLWTDRHDHRLPIPPPEPPIAAQARPQFHYRRIGQALLQELEEQLGAGSSVALFGPRYAGKWYLEHLLGEHFQKARRWEVLELPIPRAAPPSSETELCELLAEVIGSPRSAGRLPPRPSLPDLTRALVETTEGPKLLLVSNVETLPSPLVRRFLEELRGHVPREGLGVLLAGEYELWDLVVGEAAPFECAQRYMLQYLHRQEFDEFVGRYAREGRIAIADPGVLEALWHHTGGSTFQAWMILSALVELGFRTRSGGEGSIGSDDVRSAIDRVVLRGPSAAAAIRSAAELVGRDPECWTPLEELLRGSTTPIGSPAPGILEFAGITVRNDGKLQFTSPLMEALARRHFSSIRLGDLYARVGRWSEAFQRYRPGGAQPQLRPVNADDAAELGVCVHALGASLYSEAARGHNAVLQLFSEGCRCLLGCVVYQYHWDTRGTLAQSEATDETQGRDAQAAERYLRERARSHGLIELPPPWAGRGLALDLPGAEPEEHGAVFLWDPVRPLGVERDRVARVLLGHLRAAYGHAVGHERTESRLKARERYVRIINSIWESIGRQELSEDDVIKQLALCLQDLGYRRVMLARVDRVAGRIRGVFDARSEGPDIAPMTDVPLDEHESDIQPWVVRYGRPEVIRDAAGDPRANRRVVCAAGIKAFAVIPLFGLPADPIATLHLERQDAATGGWVCDWAGDNVVATLHVERQDGAAPTMDELKDLFDFGRQLSLALEYRHRVELLTRALDGLADPVVIADSTASVRYANARASADLGVPEGWTGPGQLLPQPSAEACNSHDPPDEPCPLALLRSVCSGGGAVRRHVRWGWGEHNSLAQCDPIPGGHGAVLRLLDLDYLYRIFDAIRLICSETTIEGVMRGTLRAAEQLRHGWGRLYFVDDEDRLVSQDSFGFDDPDLARRFREHGFPLPRREDNQGAESWLAFAWHQPLVLCYRPGAPGDWLSSAGLRCVNVTPECPEELSKKKGEIWIEFPFMAGDRPLGKLTLACSDKVTPSEFDLLKVLYDLVGVMLDHCLRRSEDERARERAMREATNHVIWATAHHLGNCLAPFSPYLEIYRGFETRLPELTELNEDVSSALRECETEIERTKQTFRQMTLKREVVDLAALIRDVLERTLPEGSGSVEFVDGTVWVDADPHLLRGVFTELVCNSREAADGPPEVSITVASVVHDGMRGAKVWFHDRGPGIPSHLKERVFEVGYSDRRHSDTGTGLGLSFIRRVIEAHGGSVSEEGSAGQGAAFIISLPERLGACEG